MDEYVRIPKTLLLDHLAAVDEFAAAAGRRDDAATAKLAHELTVTMRLIREEIKPLECICPAGFGAVADPRCPTHGPGAAHTITGASA